MRNNLLKGLAASVKEKGDTHETSSGDARSSAPSSVDGLKKGLSLIASGAPQEIDTDAIDDSKVQDRFDVKSDIEDLVRSIKASGQKLPALLRKTNTPGRFEVVYGRRRIEACRQLGIPVKAYITEMSDKDALISQGLENSARLQRSFIEQAVFASQLLAQQDVEISKDEVIELLATDGATMSRMLKVVRQIPSSVIHKIGPAHEAGRRPWLELCDLLSAKAAPLEEEVLSLIEVSKGSRDRLFALIECLKGIEGNLGSVADPAASEASEPKTARGTEKVVRVYSGGRVKSEFSPGRLVIKEGKGGPGFSDFLNSRLESLYKEFSEQKWPQED